MSGVRKARDLWKRLTGPLRRCLPGYAAFTRIRENLRQCTCHLREIRAKCLTGFDAVCSEGLCLRWV